MQHEGFSRRLFLSRSLGGISAAWFAANMPGIRAAAQHAHQATLSREPTTFDFFTSEQSAVIEAVTAQIIPTDDTPGAREARVVFFIDRALTTFDKDKQPAYVKGLAQLQAKQKKMFSGATNFAALTPEQQLKVLKSIEKTDFFELVRSHTIIGFLANPSYGGNHDRVGWKAIGFEDSFFFTPPFGFYDREHGK